MTFKTRLKNWKKDLLEVIKIMSESNLPVFASSSAFFIFLSMIPLMVLFFSTINLIPSFDYYVALYLENAFSEEVTDFLVDVINKVLSSSPGILSISVVLILWSAGKGMQYIGRGLNIINGIKENRFFLLQRVEGCVYTIILILMLIGLIGISIFGTVIINIATKTFQIDLSWLTSILHYRFLVEWVIIAAIFCMVYAWLPRKKVMPYTKWRGALFAGVTITLFSSGFTFYIEHIYSFTLYGSLATIIIVNIWIYVSCYLFLTGEVINQHFQRRQDKGLTGKEMQ